MISFFFNIKKYHRLSATEEENVNNVDLVSMPVSTRAGVCVWGGEGGGAGGGRGVGEGG